ncbi:hypothetical protein PUNSTDRAFT_57152, partial [Punctularia strigosozonata HHB-11173 SS5]|uniref:uncharacterized protein n=1 Tax=Punctularia strigosozonata (strain HHB-11173) TaxID=741275 RepID=UPI0004417A41
LMNLLRHTMTSKSGGYITPRLHVPQEVWSQGGAKLANLPEKVRAVEVLCSALEEIQNSSQEFFGFGSLTGQGMTAIAKKEGEAWGAKLEDFATVCDGIVGSFGKKLGVGEGLITKKTGGVRKLTRQLDKLTNTKKYVLDSPASYVQGLARLFNLCQVLDEHTKALYSQPVAPVYSSLPVNVQSILQARLRHTSEFFANVVLTFVIRDLSLLLDKYAKKCEKWLAE